LARFSVTKQGISETENVGVTMGATHGWTMMDLGARSCIMIMTIVISIAVWMARYLEEFFGTNGFVPVPIAALVCAMSLFSGRHHSEIYHCAVCGL